MQIIGWTWFHDADDEWVWMRGNISGGCGGRMVAYVRHCRRFCLIVGHVGAELASIRRWENFRAFWCDVARSHGCIGVTGRCWICGGGAAVAWVCLHDNDRLSFWAHITAVN